MIAFVKFAIALKAMKFKNEWRNKVTQMNANKSQQDFISNGTFF